MPSEVDFVFNHEKFPQFIERLLKQPCMMKEIKENFKKLVEKENIPIQPSDDYRKKVNDTRIRLLMLDEIEN